MDKSSSSSQERIVIDLETDEKLEPMEKEATLQEDQTEWPWPGVAPEEITPAHILSGVHHLRLAMKALIARNKQEKLYNGRHLSCVRTCLQDAKHWLEDEEGENDF